MTGIDEQPVRTETERVRQALGKGKRKRVRKILRGMHPGKAASLIESLEPDQRLAAWQQIDDDAEQAVLAHISKKLRGALTLDADSPDGASEKEAEARTELARLRDALGRLFGPRTSQPQMRLNQAQEDM